MQLCERLKELRQESKLSQQEIANILEIRQQQYSRYESGTRELPIHLLVKLADFYEVSTDYLLGRSDEARAEQNENIG